MIRLSARVIAGIALLIGTGGARAASFDCASATAPLERTICADPVLSGLDDRLAQAWSRAQASVSGEQRAALVTEQRQWLKTRGPACLQDDQDFARRCLAARYTQRLAALSAPAGAAPVQAPAPVPAAAPVSAVSAEAKAVVDEVRRRFTVKGRPVHPLVIRDLAPWISDNRASVVAIDILTAAGSNQYFADEAKVAGGWVEASRKEEGGDTVTIRYRFAGTLSNGLIAVQTETRSGRSVFEAVSLFDLTADLGLTFDDKPYDRVCLKLVRLIEIGDRTGAQVRVEGNAVVVTEGGAVTARTEGRRP